MSAIELVLRMRRSVVLNQSKINFVRLGQSAHELGTLDRCNSKVSIADVFLCMRPAPHDRHKNDSWFTSTDGY